MNHKTDLNIYQLPGENLVAKQNVTGWGLDKTLAFARGQYTEYKRICHIDQAAYEAAPTYLDAVYKRSP